MLRVAVGSKNPVKLRATRNVFRALVGRVQVTGVKVERPFAQPLKQAQIIEGAASRAEQALRAGSYDFGVGIEAGLTPAPHARSGFIDVQWCAILDRKGGLTLGHGGGFEYPLKVIEEVFARRREVGKVMEHLSGVKRIGERMGAIGYLSRGRLTRTRLTEPAVFMAMLPRIRASLYGLPKLKLKGS
jgi:inosine/xanthosine triphosphatase